jgi:capsular polysaccharide transport system permease protein
MGQGVDAPGNLIAIEAPVERAHQPAINPSSRAMAISGALRVAARKARVSVAGDLRHGFFRAQRWQHRFARGVAASFILSAVLPTLVFGLYFSLLASDQYVSEVKFAVRDGQRPIIESIGQLAGLPPVQSMQDALILSEYIRSRGLFEDLDQDLHLRQLYSRSDVDFFSRLKRDEAVEDVVRYWRRRVDVDIDSNSGIVTVLVRAFSAADALHIATAIVSRSERLVNELSERSRQNALKEAQGGLSRAEERLRASTAEMRSIRNTEGVLDAGRTAEVLTKITGELRLQLITAEQENETLQGLLSPDAPQLRILRERIANMREQIESLERKMTTKGESLATLSGSMERFDRGTLDRKIAEQQYIAAAAAFEQARLNVETQQVYLATFLYPTLAQEALYPRRLLMWLAFSVSSLALWGAGVGSAVLVKNHIAV